MHHFVTEMCTYVHISITKWCIVGYGTGVSWDLCNKSIGLVPSYLIQVMGNGLALIRHKPLADPKMMKIYDVASPGPFHTVICWPLKYVCKEWFLKHIFMIIILNTLHKKVLPGEGHRTLLAITQALLHVIARCPLHWRSNKHDSISNYLCLDCLLNCLFRHRSKKTSRLCVTGLCEGNPPWTRNCFHLGMSS